MSNAFYVTGFDPFGRFRRNPSAELVNNLKARHPKLLTKILHTDFIDAPRAIQSIIEQQPKALLMFGYSQKAQGFKLEQFARNVDYSQTGHHPINPSYPARLSSNVDTARLATILTNHGYAANASSSAGTFVCNHSYFIALSLISTLPQTIPCLFVHLPKPSSPEQSADFQKMADLIVSYMDNM